MMMMMFMTMMMTMTIMIMMDDDDGNGDGDDDDDYDGAADDGGDDDDDSDCCVIPHPITTSHGTVHETSRVSNHEPVFERLGRGLVAHGRCPSASSSPSPRRTTP